MILRLKVIWQNVYNYPMYPRDEEACPDKVFVYLDNGAKGGYDWTCFFKKHNKSVFFDSFGWQLDKILFTQSLKPVVYQNCEKQHKNSRLFGTYCLYFSYLINRMSFYDAVLKFYFDQIHLPINVLGSTSGNTEIIHEK